MSSQETISAAALYNAGKSLKDQGRYLEAAERFHQALSIDSTDADAAYMLANSLREMGSLDDAVVAYDAAIALRPTPDALTNKGIVLRRCARPEEAIDCFRGAIALDPGNVEAHWNLSLALLLTGIEDEGWREYEWRWSLHSFPNYGRTSNAPRWTGCVDHGATVLLRSEQGFGDAIQFARYIPRVAERCKTVIVECPPELATLFRTVRGVGQIIPAGGQLPAHDFECPFMSLPGLPGFAPGQLAWEIPYLHDDPATVRRWESVLGKRNGVKIGIVWGGRIGRGSDAERSIALEQLLPLSAIGGISWVSLQQGPARDQRADLGWEMLDAGSLVRDFADTAGVLAGLDLVISIDSAVAHLAGALGKPVWTLLPFAADWRWQVRRTDTPWYPTMRLFRQSSPGEWGPVVEELHVALRRTYPGGRRAWSAPAAGKRGPELVAEGNRAFDTGDVLSAEALFRRAKDADPTLTAAWFNLGNALERQQRHDEAIECYIQARTLVPDHHAILHNLGVAYAAVGRLDEAVEALSDAVRKLPGSADYRNSLGNAYAALGDHDTALESYRSALQLEPGAPHIHYNAGEELLKLWRLSEAAAAYRRTLELDSSAIPAYHNLGHVLVCDRKIDEAIDVYEQGLARAPEDTELRWNLAQALLLKGDYLRGWNLYEHRWQTIQFKERAREFPFPAWDGSSPAGKTILAYTEQGFGDAIQFVRYAGVLASAGARVVVECPPELQRLFRSVRGVSGVVATGESPGSCDVTCPLMSLPAILGTTLTSIPADVPYLDVEVSLLEEWRKKVDERSSGYRIGLVWSGRDNQWNQKHRALGLSDLAPMGNIPGVTLFSLQIGEAAGEIARTPLPVVDLTGGIRDFADTAALILNLDCVVGIDTAVLHLAGALGKPTWALLPYSADWRWLLDREDSPWYPTLRLIRQRSAGDWQEPVSEACRLIRSLLQHGGTIPGRTFPVSGEGAVLVNEATRRHREGDLPSALSGYLRALEKGVESPVLYTNVGLLLADAGRGDDSEQWLRQAIEMDPTQVAALNGVGMRMLADGALADARATFQRALRQAPGNAVVLNNIGVTLADWRELGGELACFRAAVRADDSLVDAHWNLSQAALSAGLLEEGWREYEWRWAKPDFTSPRPKLDRPLWDGSPLSGRSLLVHAEQGFGDTLQFCRYLMHPRLGGGHLVFQVQPPLLALIRESFPGVDVVTWSAPAPPTDLHVPLMSLPRLVGTTLENIPLVTPRLHPPGEVIRRWESTITRVADNLAIGFVWQGRPTQRKDRSRSLRLALLEDLLRIDGVSWYSLQVGEAARELADAPVTAKVHDLSPLLTDFVETAAAILRLDGVITVDTAVAHLAGALGKDVWVLLSSPADWRWMRERTDSPWYPSVTLIRQTVPGDWSGPVREVASMVRKRIPGGARR